MNDQFFSTDVLTEEPQAQVAPKETGGRRFYAVTATALTVGAMALSFVVLQPSNRMTSDAPTRPTVPISIFASARPIQADHKLVNLGPELHDGHWGSPKGERTLVRQPKMSAVLDGEPAPFDDSEIE